MLQHCWCAVHLIRVLHYEYRLSKINDDIIVIRERMKRKVVVIFIEECRYVNYLNTIFGFDA